MLDEYAYTAHRNRRRIIALDAAVPKKVARADGVARRQKFFSVAAGYAQPAVSVVGEAAFFEEVVVARIVFIAFRFCAESAEIRKFAVRYFDVVRIENGQPNVASRREFYPRYGNVFRFLK